MIIHPPVIINLLTNRPIQCCLPRYHTDCMYKSVHVCRTKTGLAVLTNNISTTYSRHNFIYVHLYAFVSFLYNTIQKLIFFLSISNLLQYMGIQFSCLPFFCFNYKLQVSLFETIFLLLRRIFWCKTECLYVCMKMRIFIQINMPFYTRMFHNSISTRGLIQS